MKKLITKVIPPRIFNNKGSYRFDEICNANFNLILFIVLHWNTASSLTEYYL